MPLPQEFIQELRARNDIESVISSYVNLRRRGRNLVGLCPFHNEKTPSFTVYPENGSFYCFGCGAGGDAITFIRKIENLDYIEAVRFLAARAGMQMPQEQESDGTAAIRTRILEMNRAAGRFFYSVLYSPAGAEALDYLHRRGLSDATIRHFGLGFAPDSWDALLKHMKPKGFTGEDLRVADLALKGRRESYYDKFRNRVIFPIIDLRGSVIGFGGRVMDDSKPKYLNTADTLVFKKSMNLFAMNFAKNARADCLILAEGYMDVISMHQAGFTHAAAKLGTALTLQQAKLLKRYTDEIIIAGDNDEAGQKAVARDIGMLRDAGLSIRVLTVPDGKDPDEYIRENGPLKFKHLLDKTGNDIEYRLAKIRGKYSLAQTDGKVAFLKEAVEMLAGLDGAIERDVYAGKLAEELSVSRDTIMMQMNELRKKQFKARQRQQFREIRKDAAGYSDRVNPERAKVPRAAAAEEGVLAILLTHPDYLHLFSKTLGSDLFVTAFNRRVFEAVEERIRSGEGELSLMLTLLGEQFSEDEMAYIAGISARHVTGSDAAGEMEDCIRTLKVEQERLKASNPASMSIDEVSDYLKRLGQEKKD